MPTPPEEKCCLCDSLTGRAGRAEDSIYRCCGELGPLCEECDYTLAAEYGEEADNADTA